MKMKPWLTVMLVAGLAAALVPTLSEAARLGGGRPAGMQRAAPAKPVQNTPPANAAPTTPTAPAATPAAPAVPAAAAAVPPRRSWMGPLAGLAAGLGLAALFSHFGMGEQFSSLIMMALLAVVAVVAIRFLMRRFAGGGAQGQPLAMAGAAALPRDASTPAWAGSAAVPPTVTIGSALQPAPAIAEPAAPSALALPAGFDATAFERLAKMIFIRMQAANDSADLNDLRTFTTPELFASLRLDLQDRGDVIQQTDVVKVQAQLIDFEQEGERQIVSVRFEGVVREAAGAEPTPFDEVWHLVRPLDGSRDWAIAGIQPRQ
jgi:predicted lipid-binding transport protein (Tim44 family)